MTDGSIRMILRDKYLDYLTDCLTLEKFAEHNNLSVKDAKIILEAGENIYNENLEIMKYCDKSTPKKVEN